MSSRTYFRIPNATLVWSRGGMRPHTEIGVVVYLVDTYSARFLLIEFPHCSPGDLPFPTGRAQWKCPILVNKLPMGFVFDPSPVDWMYQWSAKSDVNFFFALIFNFKADYEVMQAVMADVDRSYGSRANRRRKTTNVASMTTRTSLVLRELFRQLEVDQMPAVEEECVAA